MVASGRTAAVVTLTAVALLVFAMTSVPDAPTALASALGSYTYNVPNSNPDSRGFDENAFLENRIGAVKNGKFMKAATTHPLTGVGAMRRDSKKMPWEPSLGTTHTRYEAPVDKGPEFPPTIHTDKNQVANIIDSINMMENQVRDLRKLSNQKIVDIKMKQPTTLGPPGPRGHKGARGPRGAKGQPGPQGPMGGQGPKGHTGHRGPRGARGFVGPKGSTGMKGPRGPRGRRGRRGRRGYRGPKGPKGRHGFRGRRGPRGITRHVTRRRTIRRTITSTRRYHRHHVSHVHRHHHRHIRRTRHIRRVHRHRRVRFRPPAIRFSSRRSTFSTRRGQSLAHVKNLWNRSQRTRGYCTRQLSVLHNIHNQGVCRGPKRNIAYKFDFSFTVRRRQRWQFRLGSDFGRGGLIMLDHRRAIAKRLGQNLWWAHRWNNRGVVSSGWLWLSPGRHTITYLGFEGCCDGRMSAQYRIWGRHRSRWRTASLHNLWRDTRNGRCGSWCRRYLRAVRTISRRQLRRIRRHPRRRVPRRIRRRIVRRRRVRRRRRPCFPASATVQLETGALRRMDALEHGDRVLTVRNDGAREYSPVFFFGHRDAKDSGVNRCLRTEAGRTLCLSHDHYVVASQSGLWADARYVRSEDVQAGETMWLHGKCSDEAKQQCSADLSASKVVSVEDRWMSGLYNPYTLTNAMIVVDGVVASTHSSWFLDDLAPRSLSWALPSIYEKALAPARWIYQLKGAAWTAALQERLSLDTMAQEETGVLALVKPYLALGGELLQLRS